VFISISGLISFFVQESLELMKYLGVSGVFILMVLEGVGLPFPSELIMTFAGFLSNGNIYSLAVYALAGSVGGYIGNLILYFISVYGGRPLILAIGKYFGLREEHLLATERWFDKRGEWTVFFGRFVPGFRSYMSIPAGIAKMSLVKFTIFTLAGSFIWSSALAVGGYTLGSNWSRLLPILYQLGEILLIIFILAIVGYISYIAYRRKKRTVNA
jgi:membrane protein DedA with SNARE-associated domain